MAERTFAVRLLGPVQVQATTDVLSPGGTKARALLADLALNVGSVVPVEQLIDDLWGDNPPVTARHAIEEYVSRLRSAFRRHGLAQVLKTTAPGYVLDMPRGDVDVHRFEDLLQGGIAALERGDAPQASDAIGEALGIWRGRAFADLGEIPFAAAAAQHLEGRRLFALERRIDADLRLGRHAALVDELEGLATSRPFHERFSEQLMLALYQSGRQADALSAFRRTRSLLVEELGIRPGPALRRMEDRVLRHDPKLDPVPRAGPDAGPRSDAVADGAPDRGDAADTEPSERPPPSGSERSPPTRLVLAGTVAVVAVVVALVVAPFTRGTAPPVEIPTNGIAVLDPRGDDLAIKASLELRGSPGEVATGDGSVWVSSPEADAVYRIDADRVGVIETIRVGGGSEGLVVGGNAVWVANALDGTVSRIDLVTNDVVDSIDVGSQPSGISFGEGAVWVADSVAGRLTRIDPVTDRLERPIGLDVSPFGVAVGSRLVWVTSVSTNQVIAVDAVTNRITHSVGVGAGPSAIAVGYGAVWVANSRDSTVSQIDPARGSVLSTIPVGGGPSGIALGAGGVWVSTALGRSVVQIDPVHARVVRTIELQARPASIAVVDGDVWVAIQPTPTAERKGGTLRVEDPFTLTSIDPARLYPEPPFQLWTSTYDTLVTYQRVGGSAGSQLVPNLAVSLPLPTGGTTYTFVLRPGLRYSNGSPVRAADFRYAIERTLELNGGDAGSFLRGIVGAPACTEAPGACDLSEGILVDDAARTVEFRLTEADPDFLYKLTMPFTAPVPATTPRGDVGTHPVPATGPYVFASFVPGRALTLERNPEFREWSAAAQPDGYPDRIEWTFGTTMEDTVSAIERGDADWTPRPPSNVDDLAVRFASQLHVDPSLTTVFFFLNTTAPPFDDVRVRRALNLAVDRSIVTDIVGGPRSAIPACQLLPPGMPGHRPYCPYTVRPDAAGTWIAPDLPRARALVEASGTEGMQVTVWASEMEPFNRRVALHVASTLRQLGYRSSVRLLPHDEWIAVVTDVPRRAQIGTITWTADFPSPSNFYEFFLACSTQHTSNGSRFCDPQIDEQMAEAARLQTVDPVGATVLWEQISRSITDAAPVLPVAHLRSVALVSDRVSHYVYNPTWGLLLDQLWIDEQPDDQPSPGRE